MDKIILISEIGNCHFGSLEKAKTLVRMSKESGADLVKLQAVKAKDMTHGSMPYDFYAMCDLGFDWCMDLISYGISIGIDVFYSIFSKEYNQISYHQKYQKIAGSQFKKELDKDDLSEIDRNNYFISIKEELINLLPDNSFEYANIMYVSEYMTMNPNLKNIELLKNKSNIVGYSDHTTGINNCIEAVEKYGATVIEKHFTDETYKKYQGIPFRDSIHGATYKQMELLAKSIK